MAPDGPGPDEHPVFGELLKRLGVDADDLDADDLDADDLDAPPGLASVPRIGLPTNTPIEVPDPPTPPTLLTVRVDLVGASPPIWRRLELRGDLWLDEVHAVLQTAFDWTESHLHRFSAPGKDAWDMPYFLNGFDQLEGEVGTPEQEVRIDQVLRAPKDWLTYLYDFGDDWEHRLVVESVREATPDDPPALCLDGRRAGPPENVGGTPSWNELAAALRKQPDPRKLPGDLKMYADWLPPDVDPDRFDAELVNAALSLGGGDPGELLARLGTTLTAEQLPGPDGPQPPEPGPYLEDLLLRSPGDVMFQLVFLAAHAAVLSERTPELTPEERTRVLRPWQALLDAAEDGAIRLTSAGWMNPAACEYIWEHGGFAQGGGRGDREADRPGLQQVHRAARSTGLVRKSKGRLVVTALGRKAASDQGLLARMAARSLVHDQADFDRDARTLYLLFLAAGWAPDPEQKASAPVSGVELDHQVARLLNEIGWTVDDGPVSPASLIPVMALFHLLEPEIGPRDPRLPSDPAVRWLANLALYPDLDGSASALTPG